MSRSLTAVLAIVVALAGYTGTARAIAVIDVDWVGGLDAITAAPSDTVTAEIFLDLTDEAGGSRSWSFSVAFDQELSNLLDVVGTAECGTAGSAGNPTCVAGGGVGPWTINITTGVSPRNIESDGATVGDYGSWEAGSLPPAALGGGARHFVGTISFHVNSGSGTTSVLPLFKTGEQISSGTGDPPPLSTNFDGATITVSGAVPEPGTVALMGLGLLGLSVMGRRRC